jgi:allantoin racemase
MRIKIINPNTTQSMTQGIYDAAISCARPDTEIIAVSPEKGPVSIENFHDEYASIIGVMEEVHKGMKEKFDAYIVACYGDPGLYAAREIADVPVVGIAEASMHLATMVAPKFSVVTVIPRIKLLIEEVVQKYGFRERCASVRTTNMSVLGFEEDPERGMEELARESKKAIEEDGAEAICLGCAGMVKFANDLEKELGVPVFDGVTAAVKMAEALVDLNKKTSKIMIFKYPEKKEYIGFPDILQP